MSEQPTLSLLAQEAIEELLTANDILRWAVSRFNESDVYYGHGTDNPWDEAFSLLAWGLNIGPMLNSEVLSSRLTISERKRIIDVIVARIESKKPAAYLTNQAYFVDLPFYVDENVLVPRSPIGELIKEQFKSVIDFTPNSILDLCTGSGCIAVACAYAFEEAYVDAADISPDALAIADENIHRLGVSDRVVPLLSDVFSGLGGQRYDLIVSNPPYIPMRDRIRMARHVLDFEPELALFVEDESPLIFYQKIAELAVKKLALNGALYFELNEDLAQETKVLLTELGFNNTEIRQDLQGRNRMLKAWM